MNCVVTGVVVLHHAQNAVILAGHVVRLVARRGASRILVGKAEGRRSRGRPWQVERIILKWILKK
jgi:hypothetical protein